MSLSMADVTLSGFKEPNWTYIYLFHIYMRDHVAMSDQEQEREEANERGAQSLTPNKNCEQSHATQHILAMEIEGLQTRFYDRK